MATDYSEVGLALLSHPELSDYFCDRCDQALESGDVEVDEDNSEMTIICDTCRWPHRLVLQLELVPVYPREDRR